MIGFKKPFQCSSASGCPRRPDPRAAGPFVGGREILALAHFLCLYRAGLDGKQTQQRDVEHVRDP